jgi:hypothetical protein
MVFASIIYLIKGINLKSNDKEQMKGFLSKKQSIILFKTIISYQFTESSPSPHAGDSEIESEFLEDSWKKFWSFKEDELTFKLKEFEVIFRKKFDKNKNLIIEQNISGESSFSIQKWSLIVSESKEIQICLI